MPHTYLSFDDDVQRTSLQADPIGYVADLPDKVVLDEVQRVPNLFTSLKAAVDARRQPGRFILTGSANVLLVPKLADSLAGRMDILRLHPLAQAELAGTEPNFLSTLFGNVFKTGACGQRLGKMLAERVAAGAYPAALARATARRRASWYRDYADTLVQRDVRDLARIHALEALPRLLTLAAGQGACLLNVADLAAPFQLSRPTIRDYMTLLARVFLLEEPPPWHSNRLSRLIKTPKLHLGDTGLAFTWRGRGSAVGGSSPLWTTIGNLCLSGATSSCQLAGGLCNLPSFSRQGRCRSGYRAGVRRKVGGRRGQGRRHRNRRRFQRIAQTGKRHEDLFCGSGGALRWRCGGIFWQRSIRRATILSVAVTW